MNNAVFLGLLDYLPRAFPPPLREQLSGRARILGADIDGTNWRASAGLLSQAEVVFSTWGMPVMDADFLACARNLRSVFYAAGSVKGFATPEAYERGINISSAWAANAIPVAEYTVATVLLSLKRFWHFCQSTRETKSFRKERPVPGGYRTKVGLVSLGAVGKLVARKLGGFELDLLAHDPFADPEGAQELGVSLVTLEDLFARCDVVSLHTPWLPETENLVNGRLLRSMKEGATLVNTSRGAVINEPELCEVLAERPDLTAILDVTYPEPPPPESPLYTLSNVLLTPHIAGSMGGEIARMGRWMTDEYFRFLDGLPLKHSVSRGMLAKMA